jgi:hypothetical protein
MNFLVLLSALVACAAGKCYNSLYSSKYLHGWPNSEIRKSNLLYIYIQLDEPAPIAARSKAEVFGLSPAEIVVSNSTGNMDVCLL